MSFEGAQVKALNIPFGALSTDQVILWTAPQNMTIKVAKLATVAALAASTHMANIQVINKGAAGDGSTVVAGYNSPTANQGATVAYVAKSMVLNTTAANLKVAAGDVIAITTTKSGTPTTNGSVTLGYVLR